MKKIYLLPNKLEINLGDTLLINGFKVVVTQAFIDSNPQSFLVKDVKKKVEEISENNIPEFVKAKLQAANTIKGRIYKTLPSKKPHTYVWKDEVSEDAVNSLEGFKTLFAASVKQAYQAQMIEDAKAKYPVGTFAKSAAIGKIYEVKSPDFIWDKMGDLINGTTERGFTVYHNDTWAKPATLAEAIREGANISKTNAFVQAAIAENVEAENRKALLKQAKEMYKIGTHYIDFRTGDRKVIKSPNLTFGGIKGDMIFANGFDIVYSEGKFAQILRPLFVTFDNVPIYGGDRSVCVSRKTFAISESLPFMGDAQSEQWYFSSSLAAKEFVKRNKPKVLADYEAQLLENEKIVHQTTSIIRGSIIGITAKKYYQIMKANDLKLYWYKVLEAIALDLNEGWKPNWTGKETEVKYSIMYNNNSKKIEYETGFRYETGKIVFKSPEAAEKAMEIIGDKFLEIIK